MRKKASYAIARAIVWGAACFMLPAPGLARVQNEAQTEVREQPPNPLTIPEGYRYDPAGRRDPFVNPITPEVVAAAEKVPDVRPPGLPGVLLNEAQLSAIVRSPQPAMSTVVIRAPGDRVFVAHAGDELYDVVIRDIRARDVVFEVKPLEGDDPLAPRALVARDLTQENE